MMSSGGEENEPVRLHAVISGLVQMVGFRQFVVRHASALGLTGWVRNTESGEVEVLAEGPKEALEALLRRLRQGPPSARVLQVEEEWWEATGEFRGFRVTW